MIVITLENYAIIKAIKTILNQPIKKFSIVELAKEAKLAPSAAKYALDYMFKNGLVKDELIGKTHQYKADTDNYLTRQWKIVFSLEDLHKAGIVERILKQSDSISSIVLYGSVAQGRDDELSDIDIIVIADVDLQTRKNILVQAHGATKEVNIIVYTPREWRKKAEIDKAFYESVILESITLYGSKPVVL